MPQYTQDEFFRLMESVAGQDGRYLNAIHEHVYHEELSGGPVHDVLQGQVKYCNESALFEVPYESHHESNTVATVRICAICDRMGLMPRFASAKAPGSGE